MKSYTELSKLNTFSERFRYLKLDGKVAEETFGYDRYLNQALYSSDEWKRIRNKVIVRDLGCDLGIEGHELNSKVIIHHMNPITKEQITNRDPIIFDMDNLIAVSHETHNALHYGDETILRSKEYKERTPNDTIPWRS